MKNITQRLIVVLPWLLFLFIPKGFCIASINCQWGPFGDWSECDGCTKLQTRSRAMVVYAQFGGNPCSGSRYETRSCVPTQVCPLEDGCGDRFRCRSGMCISQSLVCNGDVDCVEDQQDERDCETSNYIVCTTPSVLPPATTVLGKGVDVVTEQRRATVIDTLSFGGQCRPIFSGLHSTLYRLPQSIIQYSFMVKVQNDFSDEMYSSRWHYARDISRTQRVTGTTEGYHSYNFLETETKTETHKLLVLKNHIEVAQFQSNSPQNIPLAEEFWKALVKLPSVYDYAAYRKVLERFGTHYVSEGSLGGSFKAIVKIDAATQRYMRTENFQYNECRHDTRWYLFIPVTTTTCNSDSGQTSYTPDDSVWNNHVAGMDIEGGGPEHTFALKYMQLSDGSKNWEKYSNWADSVRSFPSVTKQKLRPISELVKEVPYAGVKKIYLRRAIEQYTSERDLCHCQPCRNSGIVTMAGDECRCICKRGTSGSACEYGTPVEGQQGVIDGGWSCWSSWTDCNSNTRTRSRVCSNPAPANGGQHCIGESTETSNCDDQDLQYFLNMYQTLPDTKKCGTPPALINGFIVDPKDIYFVGNRVEYRCTSGFYLYGQGTIECNPNQSWSDRPGLCTISRCKLSFLADGVKASPSQTTYDIGMTVTLSCPEGSQLLGESVITCDSSLNFSPDPADISCSPIKVNTQQQTSAVVQCQPWEKSSRGRCVCKMPFECSSSLEVCASSAVGAKSVLLTVCKMHALKCLSKDYLIAEDSTCKWPQRSTTGCTSCHMWETCDDQTSQCRCRDAADCSNPGANVCVRVGEDASATSQTMSECEAGLRRCKGEKVSLVSILPCAA